MKASPTMRVAQTILASLVVSLQPEQIHGAVAADADLRMAAPVDTRRARQLDIPGYSLPIVVHAD